jgi:hypothetical protein
MQLHRWPEAADAAESALAIETRLIERDPTNREYRRDMAGLYGMMSTVHAARGDAATAEKYAAMNRAERARLK